MYSKYICIYYILYYILYIYYIYTCVYSSFSDSSPVKALPAPLALPYFPHVRNSQRNEFEAMEIVRTERWGYIMGLIRIHCVLTWGFCKSWGQKSGFILKKTNASTMKHEDFLLIPKTIDLNIINGTCESIVRISPTRPGSHQDGQDTESVWWFFLIRRKQ